MNYSLPVTVIEGRSSLPFLEQVFRCYRERKIFTICRPGVDVTAYPSLDVRETLGSAPGYGWASLSLSPADHDAGAPAQIVFSSGTESKPKAVVLSRRALTDSEDRLIEIMRITSEIREYIGVPVTYSFGLGRARVVARVGGKFYLPERFDPVEIRDMLARDEINAISAVPSMWRILLAQPEFLGDLGKKVRWIEIGSQYMSADEKFALGKLFPNARIVQHYGLTEASRSTFLVIDEAPEEVLESVGRPIGETGIRIGPEGEICIRGPHLASGILTDTGELTPIVAEDGELHTRDRGELRDGWLYFRGRLDDQINLSGIKLAAEALENEVAALVTLAPGHFALTSVEDALRGETLLLAYDAHAAASAGLLEAALLQVLAAKGIHAAGQIRVLGVEALPRTETNKIQRKALRALWAERHHKPEGGSTAALDKATGNDGLTETQQRIADVWYSVLGPVQLRPESGFYDVGGDSLGAMQIGLAMEAHFPRDVVRATLEGRSLAEIAALLDAETPRQAGPKKLPDRTVKTWAVNLTRGFMVVAVILSHWMPGVWARLAPDMELDPIALISRMGTPGFAIVFGLGMACFMLEGYPDNRYSIRRRVTFSLSFVFLAMLLDAVVQEFLLHAEGEPLTGRSWGEAFYSVLGYYLLALASVPLWLRFLHNRIIVAATLSIPVLWIAWLLSQYIIGPEHYESPLEWVRLMIVARYSYFGMTAMVFCGVLLGTWMMREQSVSTFSRQAMLFGGVITVLGLILASRSGSDTIDVTRLFDRDAPFWSHLVGLQIDIGFTMLVLGLSVLLVERWGKIPSLLRQAGRFMILLGGLALPAYALHSIVIPLKDLLVLYAFPSALALSCSLLLFFGLIGYGMWRLNRMYFR